MSGDERGHTSTTARVENNEVTEQVFERFKQYLEQKVESLSKNLSSEASGRSKQIERQAEGQSRKFAGSKLDQFLFNVEIQDSLEETAAILNRMDIPNALDKLESTLGLLRQRQKKIKLADKSEASWLVVKEYEAEELASNSKDEKRIRKAQTTALCKKSKAANGRAKSRRYASNSFL
jgi:ATP-dependent protease HslVU (ClpYQ) ATPase subunit